MGTKNVRKAIAHPLIPWLGIDKVASVKRNTKVKPSSDPSLKTRSSKNQIQLRIDTKKKNQCQKREVNKDDLIRKWSHISFQR